MDKNLKKRPITLHPENNKIKVNQAVTGCNINQLIYNNSFMYDMGVTIVKENGSIHSHGIILKD